MGGLLSSVDVGDEDKKEIDFSQEVGMLKTQVIKIPLRSKVHAHDAAKFLPIEEPSLVLGETRLKLFDQSKAVHAYAQPLNSQMPLFKNTRFMRETQVALFSLTIKIQDPEGSFFASENEELSRMHYPYTKNSGFTSQNEVVDYKNVLVVQAIVHTSKDYAGICSITPDDVMFILSGRYYHMLKVATGYDARDLASEYQQILEKHFQQAITTEKNYKAGSKVNKLKPPDRTRALVDWSDDMILILTSVKKQSPAKFRFVTSQPVMLTRDLEMPKTEQQIQLLLFDHGVENPKDGGLILLKMKKSVFSVLCLISHNIDYTRKRFVEHLDEAIEDEVELGEHDIEHYFRHAMSQAGDTKRVSTVIFDTEKWIRNFQNHYLGLTGKESAFDLFNASFRKKIGLEHCNGSPEEFKSFYGTKTTLYSLIDFTNEEWEEKIDDNKLVISLPAVNGLPWSEEEVLVDTTTEYDIVDKQRDEKKKAKDEELKLLYEQKKKEMDTEKKHEAEEEEEEDSKPPTEQEKKDSFVVEEEQPEIGRGDGDDGDDGDYKGEDTSKEIVVKKRKNLRRLKKKRYFDFDDFDICEGDIYNGERYKYAGEGDGDGDVSVVVEENRVLEADVAMLTAYLLDGESVTKDKTIATPNINRLLSRSYDPKKALSQKNVIEKWESRGVENDILHKIFAVSLVDPENGLPFVVPLPDHISNYEGALLSLFYQTFLFDDEDMKIQQSPPRHLYVYSKQTLFFNKLSVLEESMAVVLMNYGFQLLVAVKEFLAACDRYDLEEMARLFKHICSNFLLYEHTKDSLELLINLYTNKGEQLQTTIVGLLGEFKKLDFDVCRNHLGYFFIELAKIQIPRFPTPISRVSQRAFLAFDIFAIARLYDKKREEWGKKSRGGDEKMDWRLALKLKPDDYTRYMTDKITVTERKFRIASGENMDEILEEDDTSFNSADVHKEDEDDQREDEKLAEQEELKIRKEKWDEDEASDNDDPQPEITPTKPDTTESKPNRIRVIKDESDDDEKNGPRLGVVDLTNEEHAVVPILAPLNTMTTKSIIENRERLKGIVFSYDFGFSIHVSDLILLIENKMIYDKLYVYLMRQTAYLVAKKTGRQHFVFDVDLMRTLNTNQSYDVRLSKHKFKNMFKSRMWFFPVVEEMHAWLMVADFQQKTIFFYDSVAKSKPGHYSHYINLCKTFIQDVWKRSNRESPPEMKDVFLTKSPKQTDPVNCTLYSYMIASHFMEHDDMTIEGKKCGCKYGYGPDPSDFKSPTSKTRGEIFSNLVNFERKHREISPYTDVCYEEGDQKYPPDILPVERKLPTKEKKNKKAKRKTKPNRKYMDYV